MKSNRPYSVTLTALGVLTITVFFITRSVQTIKLWDFLATLDTTVPPLYLVVTGFLFGLPGIPLVYGLWVGASWAPRTVQIYSVLGIIYYWLDRLILAAPEVRDGNISFAVGFSIIILTALFLVLSQPKVQAYFNTDMEN